MAFLEQLKWFSRPSDIPFYWEIMEVDVTKFVNVNWFEGSLGISRQWLFKVFKGIVGLLTISISAFKQKKVTASL